MLNKNDAENYIIHFVMPNEGRLKGLITAIVSYGTVLHTFGVDNVTTTIRLLFVHHPLTLVVS